ncbi:UDP-N-acetylenolpyruvoylglucosamine reductase [Corynebacterium aquilae DSM 44791]|uniref:UDP-N-acetylenolpyruvoylglucosamine reductase n=1 Tax=Corynebacterium aquilae DSM 44791 TaxID=1431546 RepID=A0A1L7CDK6_9CORY|nr:UDP-N-acetylenolpyruvoylglucosamine reductase [Corynebacterium aquilae DSM 44791]
MPRDLANLVAKIPGADTIDTTFAELTTLHIGGRPALAVRCTTTEAIAATVRTLDDNEIPSLIVGGGSNLVVSGQPLDLVAVIIDNQDITINPNTGIVTADAGVVWDELVETTVAAGLGGLECLSGIPGTVGATPVQNVGAYGVEVVDVLHRVELYDRTTKKTEWVEPAALNLSYRYSNLKFTARAVVARVEFALNTDGLSQPLRFGELARKLGVEKDETTPRRDPHLVRDAVLDLRNGKGMVYNPADHDTWSAGSFFTNPIVPAAAIDEVKATIAQHVDEETFATMPCFSVDGGYKLSAAWLIDKAGYTKGYPGENAPARLSTKHTLALTNRGQATTQDIVDLARDVRAGVKKKFGVTLEPEPVWVGVSIDS